jgi:hypothetical protein
VPLQERQIFLLKASGPMMFGLILDVMDRFGQLGDANAEGAVTLTEIR